MDNFMTNRSRLVHHKKCNFAALQVYIIMNKIKRLIITSQIVLFSILTLFAGNDGVSLKYSQPSAKWMGSLPLGNGRIGAMVYGGVDQERIALNEVTLWSGQYDSQANDLCGPEHLKEIRQAFFEGDIPKGNDLGTKYLSGQGKSFGTHLPLGDLTLTFKNKAGIYTDYQRNLHLDRAVANVNYKQNGTVYQYEYFSSNPAHVFVAHYTTTSKKGIDAEIRLDLLRHNKIHVEGNKLIAVGDARFDKFGSGGVNYMTEVKALTQGGKLSSDSTGLIVSDAKEITLIVDIRTDFNEKEYKKLCEETVQEASLKSYKTLLKEHIADFSRLFNRMSLTFNAPNTFKTTDALFNKVHSGKPDAAFDALFFQYGRYMLLSSSREDSPLPANLQGIWNDNLACNMPWTCDYHLDINIEQNYWSANIANMPECNEPLFKYIGLLSKYGHDTAKKVYGCDGWVAHTINNVWGDTAPGGGVGWALNVTAGAWLATQLWTHYRFTHDQNYLRNVGYPLLKETAKFFMDYMVKDPNTGYLVTGPSISPENAFRMKDGGVWCMSMMPTIDRAVVYNIYDACIQSCDILGLDKAFGDRLKEDIKLLPPLKVGKNGELNEWTLDVERADKAHRHASHLVALYPFGEISPVRDPLLADGCRAFLAHQLGQPNWEDTEWSRGNAINFYARLKEGSKAYESIVGLYKVFMRENLMTVSPAGVAGASEDIFSFDASEAAVAGTCEMILQSYDGLLDFLPALPKQWMDGQIKGICAEGGITADITWKSGRVVKASLVSNNDQTVKCKVNGSMKTYTLKKNKKQNISI